MAHQHNLGDEFAWSPLFQDYKQILEQLKSQDDMIIFEAVMGLQNQLSIAQENTLSNFAVDQYIVALIEILKRPPMSDISNEINMFTIQCLTNLMDIFPNICNNIVNNGGVKSFAQVLERSMGFIDLNEACIKAIEKISLENPYAILTSGAMTLVLNMMDFFEMTTQKRIISIIMSISRHSANENDLNDQLMPMIPCLCMLLHQRGADSASKIESVTHIILRICESIFRFISPHTQTDKVTVQFDKIAATGIIDAILQTLQDYCEYENTMRASLQSNPLQQQQQTQKIMTTPTIQNILKILSIFTNYSLKQTRNLLDFNILKTIQCFLPSIEDQKLLHFSLDNYPFILETINFIEALLPQREEEDYGLFDPILIGQSPAQIQMKTKFEQERRVLYLEPKQQQQIFYAAEKLLPKIFNVHENNFQASLRAKTLKTIDKLILLFNEELLNNFIEPYSFAKFINSNLRSNQISSIIICMQMIDKLMKSNPKNYTLPLIREGVPSFIKSISTQEDLEKVTGLSFAAAAQTGQVDKHEEMLAQAKLMLAKGPGVSEGSPADQQLHFQQTIQRYMELAKLSSGSSSQPGQQNKLQVKQAQSVVAMAVSLREKYFENDEFLKSITSGEDIMSLNKLKQLAAGLIDEAKKNEFDYEANRRLLVELAQALTKSGQSMMGYELKESGLLEALKMYLTMSPQQIEVHCQIQKSQTSGEEIKHSEELQMSTNAKNAIKISKKQARCYIQRLKVFLHVVLNKVNGKQPIQELVVLCHDFLSQSENLIFEQPAQQPGLFQDPYANPFGAHQITDPNQSMHALKQLTRRMRVNLVYDPEKSTLNNKNLPGREAAMSGIQQELHINEPLLQQPQLGKASSHHPAFLQLADIKGAGDQESLSKVFVKRNFLYNELKQVMVSVEHCASLFLLEDFLRNRIKTIEDVKNLKIPQQSLYGNLKQATTSSTRPMGHRYCRLIVDRCIDRLRDMLESGGTRNEIRGMSEEFAEWVMDQIFKDSPEPLQTLDQIEIVRQIEIHALQMMDDYYHDHANEEDAIHDRLMAGESVKEEELDFDERMFEFQKTINRIRELFRQRKDEEAEGIKDKKKPVAASEKSEDIDMKEPEEEKKQSELLAKENSEDHLNVEMSADNLDEEEEEAQKRYILEEMEERRRRREDSNDERIEGIMINPPEKIVGGKEAITDDLEQLIKANGDDIEYEFFIMGELVPPNQTIYEILRQIEARQKRGQKIGAQSPSTLGGVSNALNNILSMLQGRDNESLTVHFAIKDRVDNIQKSRKDSIMEFAQKRERTKSEAFDEISVASINSLVQQLIDKEFQVIGREVIDSKDKNYEEKQILESSLKILKVLNFLCKNINLFSGQGLKFLISNQLKQDEEMKEEGFQDIDLQIGLSQIHQNLFHHHKLDAYILKNIQDPYNLISGAVSETLTQIFRTCPFLFPFQTRLLFFKLISFIGSIDMNRSIYFLRQFLKQKLGKLPPEDKNSVKLQKQKVIVDRAKILECSFNLLSKVSNRAFLEVEYKDEQGTGLGPTLEFYYLVAQEIRNFKIPASGQSIWRHTTDDNTLFPSPINVVKMPSEEVQKVYEVYRLAGMIIAKSISDDRLIDLPLSPVLWDLILGKKMNIFDLERLSPELFKSFANFQLLANKKKDVDKTVFTDAEQKKRVLSTLKVAINNQEAKLEDLSLNFTLPGYPEIELKPDGKDTDVTLENLQDYIDLTLHYMFHESLKIQIQAFKKGFNQIFPVDNLKPFAANSTELEDMICGTQRNEEEWTSIQKLSEVIVPAHGYHQKSQAYLFFLRFMTELTRDQRKMFLKFVTGSPRLPNGGFGSLDPKLTVVLKKPEVPKSLAKTVSQEMINTASQIDEILPSVMTCQNYVKLPAYSCYEALKAKFEKAYEEGCNNFTLS